MTETSFQRSAISCQPKLLILASTSPRRRDLLTGAGIRFQHLSPGVDESYNRSDFDGPPSIVQALALRKARAVAARLSELHPVHETVLPGARDRVILGADTMVEAQDGEILGTPVNRAEARVMLRMLSGRTHRVHTGVALVMPTGSGTEERTGVDTAAVTFHALSDAAIEAYVATGECDDKAGAYGYQEKGRALVSRVEGDPQTVIGLPVALVQKLLKEMGWEQ